MLALLEVVRCASLGEEVPEPCPSPPRRPSATQAEGGSATAAAAGGPRTQPASSSSLTPEREPAAHVAGPAWDGRSWPAGSCHQPPLQPLASSLLAQPELAADLAASVQACAGCEADWAAPGLGSETPTPALAFAASPLDSPAASTPRLLCAAQRPQPRLEQDPPVPRQPATQQPVRARQAAWGGAGRKRKQEASPTAEPAAARPRAQPGAAPAGPTAADALGEAFTLYCSLYSLKQSGGLGWAACLPGPALRVLAAHLVQRLLPPPPAAAGLQA